MFIVPIAELSRPRNTDRDSVSSCPVAICTRAAGLFFVLHPHFNEQSLAVCKRVSIAVKYRGLHPVFAPFIAYDPALHPDRRAGGHWSPVVHFEMPCHGGQTARANSFRHRLVKQCCDDATVKKPRVTL